MFTIEDFIINVFCCVDDLLQEMSKIYSLRRKGFAPALSDSEIITMEIIGEYQGIDTDQGIWEYFREHWQPLFPGIKSRSSFVRRAANLSQYKEILQKSLAEKMGGFAEDVHLIDGIPIPLCCITRAPRCKSFRGEADYSYCASKKQKYYGFHGHLMISANGIITGFSLTPANVDERDALWDLVPQIQGLLIGDKGYISSFLKTELRALQQFPIKHTTKKLSQRLKVETTMLEPIKSIFISNGIDRISNSFVKSLDCSSFSRTNNFF
jgi:hypothetical protein